MGVTIGYGELQSALGYCNTVLSDKSVEEKLKNFIFMVDGKTSEVRVVGYNVFTFCRETLDNAVVEGIDGDWQFQVRSADLNKILHSYSNLSRTEAKTLTFSEDGVKIKVVVREEAKDGVDSNLSRDVDYYLESAPILSGVLKDIQQQFPSEDTDMIECKDVLMYIDCLFPLMSNDSGNSRDSKINFADDYVFVMSSHSSAFMNNELPGTFKNLTITYSSANFLKRVCSIHDSMVVARTSKHLCIQAGTTEAFMRFQNIKINYKMFVDKKSTELGFVVDRLYFKDVLKRMGNISNDGKIAVGEGNDLLVSNSNFQQVVPLLKVKPGTGDVSFNIAVPLLEKIIIGDDGVFEEELFMYFTPTARGYIIYLGDSTGAWFSNTQVARG